MDDDGATDNIFHAEPVCEKDRKGLPPVAKEGRQISSVPGMGTIVRIVVAACIGKGIALVPGAAGTAVDMKGKDRVAAGPLRLRQAENPGRHDNPLAGLIKTHRPVKARVLAAAAKLGNG